MRNTKLLSATFAVALLLTTANPAFAVDTDGDGWHSLVDCNDNDPSIHPAASEVVGDGVDQNCDAQEVCYADSDNDGARTTASTPSSDQDCDDNFEGRVADPLDCDDADPFTHPDGTELCDGGVSDEDCDGAADDADPEGAVDATGWYPDADSDGFGGGGGGGGGGGAILACVAPMGTVADATDCDDGDSGVHPGATETCDVSNVDEDCDLAADDLDASATGKTNWYADGDTDSYGAGAPVSACDSPPGHVADGTDCDDNDIDVRPDGTEVCDGGDVDEDCDGDADDADTGAVGMTSWYPDADSDGFGGGGGGGGGGTLACDAPPGHVADDTDCDDTDAGISPGDPEICDAANEDEDCDLLPDDLDPSVTGKVAWYADGDSDGYGVAGGSIDACDAPLGRVATSTDCNDSSDNISPADPEVCDAIGEDDDCDTLADCDDTDCTAAPSCAGTAEVFDHLECFKIKTTEKLKAYLDVDPGTNPPFELAAGCTIGKATKYCVPVMKTVAVVDATSTLTPDPNYEGQELTDDRICYKVKCPDTAVTTITLTLKDRFGNRVFSKFKSSEICTPAEQVP